MAYIVAHEQELIDSAYVLIKEKSHADDMKSEVDLHVLDTILSGVQTNFNLYAIDERLRDEYKTIEMLEMNSVSMLLMTENL